MVNGGRECGGSKYFLRQPKLLIATAILPLQKIKKNTNMIFGDHLVTVAKKQNKKNKKHKSVTLSPLGIAMTRIKTV